MIVDVKPALFGKNELSTMATLSHETGGTVNDTSTEEDWHWEDYMPGRLYPIPHLSQTCLHQNLIACSIFPREYLADLNTKR